MGERLLLLRFNLPSDHAGGVFDVMRTLLDPGVTDLLPELGRIARAVAWESVRRGVTDTTHAPTGDAAVWRYFAVEVPAAHVALLSGAANRRCRGASGESASSAKTRRYHPFGSLGTAGYLRVAASVPSRRVAHNILRTSEDKAVQLGELGVKLLENALLTVRATLARMDDTLPQRTTACVAAEQHW